MARGAGHLRAECDAELHRRDAHAARCAVHEQALAGLQLRLGEERIVRGRIDLDEATRLRPGDVLGHRERVGGVHGDQLGVPAAREERHHALPVWRLAGALEPGDVDRSAGRRRIAARALRQVGTVHARAVDADQELAVSGHWIGPFLDVKGAFLDDSRAHSVMLRR